MFGLGLGYEYSRTIRVNLDARRVTRTSNVASVEFDDNVVSASVLASF